MQFVFQFLRDSRAAAACSVGLLASSSRRAGSDAMGSGSVEWTDRTCVLLYGGEKELDGGFVSDLDRRDQMDRTNSRAVIAADDPEG